MARDPGRRVEGSLLLFAYLVLGLGAVLVFLAKGPFGAPGDAVDINTATTDRLALALHIDPALARILTARRSSVGAYRSVRQLAGVRVLDRAAAARAAAQLRLAGLDPRSAALRDLTRTLDVPRAVARRIVEFERASAPSAAHVPLDVPVLDAERFRVAAPRLVVRGAGAVALTFFGLALLMAIAGTLLAGALRRSAPGADGVLLPAMLFLCGLGYLVLFSIPDPLRDAPLHVAHAWGVLSGLLALWAAASMRSHRPDGARGLARLLPGRSALRRYTYVWALAGLCLLALLLAFGQGPRGVRLSLGGFQPVEVVKILLVLFAAGYLAEHGRSLAEALNRWRPPILKGRAARFGGLALPRRADLGPLAAVCCLALGLFVIVRDMGPALVLFGTFVGIYYVATGRSGAVWLAAIVLVACGGAAYAMGIGVIPVRVDMWLAPWDNRHRNGMQLGQALWGMASGGLVGTGLGLGAPATMPRARDDLVFAGVAEQLGLVGAACVLTVVVVLVARGLRIAVRAESDYDRLLAAGFATLLGWQVFLIVAGVTGLLPLSGLTLPFVGRGNSALLADMLMIGLLRGISTPSPSVAVASTNPVFGRAARSMATAVAFGLLGLVLLGRLAWVQALASDDIAGRTIRTPDADGVARAKVNPRLLAVEHSIERGSIYDRRGQVLATSRLDEISAALDGAPAAAARYHGKGRYYPRGELTAHLVGYLDPALGGPTGLEGDFNADLRGFARYADLVADYRARNLPRWLTGVPERVGRDVVLTLDADLQEEAFGILRNAAGARRDRRTGAPRERAAMVVLEAATGEVLVSASIPSYDPNRLSRHSWAALTKEGDDRARLLDRGRFGYYPPGSTIKVATAAAALENGVDILYDCNHVARNVRWRYGGHSYARRRIVDDAHDPPHNVIGLARALRVSCNLYFARLAIALGPEKLREELVDGFELSAVKPVAAFAADLPDNGYGQGTMLVTPTEMARVAASVANRGRMMRPLYWREVRQRRNVVRRSAPALLARPLGETNAGGLAEMMRAVVTDGTARGVFDSIPVQLAGKTGTAETNAGDARPHSWFIGYAPFTRPHYAFACLIENGGYGRSGAAPAMNAFLGAVFGR
ncbi:MAG: FtsW/RodA/SpoVE family cell cycle protein [Chthonomonadales bacterium]|nr:FtsW/RodA/SpoVE family cell cycle protein [Chthonomonadales bacterium]